MTRPPVAELLQTPGAMLTTSDLRTLGLPRRAIDAILRSVEPVYLPGYARPLIRVEDYLRAVEASTYRDDRVRSLR